MLEVSELAEVAAAFGVSDEQVRKDHLISHVLHALAQLDLPLVFFGGTALHRCHVPHPDQGGRLSEDIDLYTPHRTQVAQAITEQLPRLVRRQFPRSAWDPPLTRVKAVEAASLVTPEGLRVRLQLLNTTEHAELATWPTEVHSVQMRYRDTTPTRLRVPTLTAFAGMKTAAWMDRRTARDLYDLAVLTRMHALTAEAAHLVHQITGWTVSPYSFDAPPRGEWTEQLAHQTRHLPSAHECLATVRGAYAQALGWNAET